jgi:hypothetical protein
MGLALDTDQTFDYVLENDQDKPGDKPTFVFRFLAARDWAKVRKMFDLAAKDDDNGGYVNGCIQALRIPLVGWRNMPLEYNPDNLDLVLTAADLGEFSAALLGKMTQEEFERKNSARQLRSASKSSVGTAVTESTIAGPVAQTQSPKS